MASTHATEPTPECESEASNIEIETCFSECGNHINDDNLRLFEDVFITSEQQGEVEKLVPNLLPPKKKIFLQLIFLKTTYEKSWTDLSTWMTTLFPSFPPEKCRHLAEKTKKEAQSLITTPAKFAEFLDQEVDLYYLGPRCQAAGITRQSCDDPNIQEHERRITRGILLELGIVFGQSSHRLFLAVNNLYPNKYTKKHIISKSRATHKKHVKFRKNSSRSDAGSSYLDEEIEFTSSEQDVSELAQSCQGCSQDETLTKSVESINQTLSNELKDKQELTQDSKDKSKQILSLESHLEKLQHDPADRNATVEELQRKIEKKNEVENLKRCSDYEPLVSKEKYSKTKENERGMQQQHAADENVEH